MNKFFATACAAAVLGGAFLAGGSLEAKAQQTFVIVTHDPEVGDRCDRVVRMMDGEVVSDGRMGAPHASGEPVG